MIRKAFKMYLKAGCADEYGYIEIEDEEKWAQSADTEINRKWWKYMAPLMRVNPDDSPVSDDLRCVFHLD